MKVAWIFLKSESVVTFPPEVYSPSRIRPRRGRHCLSTMRARCTNTGMDTIVPAPTVRHDIPRGPTITSSAALRPLGSAGHTGAGARAAPRRGGGARVLYRLHPRNRMSGGGADPAPPAAIRRLRRPDASPAGTAGVPRPGQCWSAPVFPVGALGDAMNLRPPQPLAAEQRIDADCTTSAPLC